MRGVCIKADNSQVLEAGRVYYLFPVGPSHFYVSKFNKKEAHCGAFHAERFQILEDEKKAQDWPPEPPEREINLDNNKIYVAELIWRRPGYKDKELGTYYIKPGKTHGKFYKNPDLSGFGGSFPLHWFDNFREHILPAYQEQEPIKEEPEELPQDHWEQTSIFDFL